jgi:hypothetical protein
MSLVSFAAQISKVVPNPEALIPLMISGILTFFSTVLQQV